VILWIREEGEAIGGVLGNDKTRSPYPLCTPAMDDRIANLRACYRILEDKVETTLRIRSGDQASLSAMRDETLALVAVITEVNHHLIGGCTATF
jgi:hypothetical protein